MTQTAPIACVGAGLVGRAWALVFAAAGRPVRIYDQRAEAAEAALGFAAEMLPALAKEDLLPSADPAEVVSRISAASKLEGALEGATHVQESTPEDLTIKRAVFSRLDSAADPASTLASSTSALLPSSFTKNLAGRARCLVVHPINPPYLVRAVEVVPTPWTNAAVVAGAAELLRGRGNGAYRDETRT